MAKQTIAQWFAEFCYSPEFGWALPSASFLREQGGTKIYEDEGEGWYFPDGSTLEVQEDGCYAS